MRGILRSVSARVKPPPVRPPWLAVTLLALIITSIGTIGVYYLSDLSGPKGAYSPGTLADKRDGKTYKTVVIGGRKWMAENLNYPTGGSWCYDGDSSNCGKYGRLYDWETAKRACPRGWSLPKRDDWVKLGLSATAFERQPECWWCHFDVLCEADFGGKANGYSVRCVQNGFAPR